MTTLITGAAGFIGYHTSLKLLYNKETVIGIDHIGDYYDIALKHARLARLKQFPNFIFYQDDITDNARMQQIGHHHPDIDYVIHLAAQSGVRYSVEQPFAYNHHNITGFLSILELCRHLPQLKHLLYASSSSVYGASATVPFSVENPVNKPISLYAATKIADEMMAYSYSHLYQIPMSGLRLFTVYGPWGRPDMALYLFAKAIHEGTPIHLFNHGELKRDFTYIDDIVDGITSCMTRQHHKDSAGAPHRIYNLGNHKSETLRDFVTLLEHAMGKKAIITPEPMQAGDMRETFADISESTRDFGFYPQVSIEEGIPLFTEWFKKYHQEMLVFNAA